MRKTIIALISTIFLSFPNTAVADRDIRIFGQAGTNGNNGYSGSSGQNARDIGIFANGQTQTYDVSGTNGENGTNGKPGTRATQCKQPKHPPYSLIGANGGNGGSGGNGGDGGNGGNITIFYNNTAQLKKITVDNSGGVGGQGGRGTSGGEGCQATEPYWQAKYCTWELWIRRKDIAKSKWQFHSRKMTYCTGVLEVDARNHIPRNPNFARNIAFRWKYLGVSRLVKYQSQSGQRGNSGNNGSSGRNGSYGRVILIPRQEIPREKVSYSDSVANLIGKKVDLVRNIWVNRQDLRSLLNAASNVPDTYTYLLSTANLSYRLDWQAPATPQELGIADTEIGGEIVLNNTQPKISLSLPGTLEYKTKTEDNLSIISITGGFSPSRVKAFRIEKISGSGKANELILVDEGNVRKLLASTKISVQCLTKQSASGVTETDDYQLRHNVEFEVSPTAQPQGSITVTDNVYTLNLGQHFYHWLKPAYEVVYRIAISQKTKSGAVYDRDYDVQFTVQD